MRECVPSPRFARRGLAAALVVAVLFAAPTPVQASWHAMFVKVLAQINETMDQFERYSSRLEDHLNMAAGVVGTYRGLYNDVRYLSNLRTIEGIYDHMRADPYGIAYRMFNDQRGALEMYALGSARRWVRPCTASYLIPCSPTGFNTNLMQRFAYGNRGGVAGALALVDRSSPAVYTAAGMPSGPMTDFLELFNNVWHDGRAVQQRFNWNVAHARNHSRRMSSLVDETRLHARQLFSFSNSDIADVSDGDESFLPSSGSTMASYVDTIHADPCNSLLPPGLGETTLAAQLTRVDCAGSRSVDPASLITAGGESHLSSVEMTTAAASLEVHAAGMAARELELYALEKGDAARYQTVLMNRYARDRQRHLQRMECYAGEDSMPHLLDRFGNCSVR